MKRIKNNYGWTTLNDWKEAKNMKFTEFCNFLCGNEEENLNELVKLAANNCFTLQIVCVTVNENKYVMADSLTKKFLQFINNEIPIINNDKKIFFYEFPKHKQDKILRARVNSVWICMEQAEKSIFQN